MRFDACDWRVGVRDKARAYDGRYEQCEREGSMGSMGSKGTEGMHRLGALDSVPCLGCRPRLRPDSIGDLDATQMQ
jgi:hypothetical protein